MQTQKDKEKPVCPKCGCAVRFRIDGTFVCWRCGYDSRVDNAKLQR